MAFVKRGYRGLYADIIVSFIFIGMSMTLLGAVLPRILSEFRWNYTQAGLVMAAGSVGYFVSTLAFGHLTERLGLRTIMSVSLLIVGAANLLFGTLPSAVFNLVVYAVMGIGNGGAEVVVNTSVVRMEQRGESRLMGFTHAGFSVGAVAGPLAAGAILSLGGAWQLLYRSIGVIFIAASVMPLLVPFSRLDAPEDRGRTPNAAPAPKRSRAVRLEPVVAIGTVIILLYVGVELGISNWAAQYTAERFGAAAESAALVVSLFWAGLLAGRIGFPLLARRIRLTVQLTALCALATASIAAILVLPSAAAASAGFFAAGLGCSSVYPLVMSLVGQHLTAGQGAGIGIVATGGGIGSFVFPFVIAAIAERWGLGAGFLFFIAAGAALVVAGVVMHLHVSSIDRRAAEAGTEATP